MDYGYTIDNDNYYHFFRLENTCMNKELMIFLNTITQLQVKSCIIAEHMSVIDVWHAVESAHVADSTTLIRRTGDAEGFLKDPSKTVMIIKADMYKAMQQETRKKIGAFIRV